MALMFEQLIAELRHAVWQDRVPESAEELCIGFVCYLVRLHVRDGVVFDVVRVVKAIEDEAIRCASEATESSREGARLIGMQRTTFWRRKRQ